MLHLLTFLIVLMAVSGQYHSVNAESKPQSNDIQTLQQLPCNKNHNHEDHDLTGILAQARTEERAGNKVNSASVRRFVNQLSPETHVLNEEEFQKCKHALSLLDTPHSVRNVVGEDSSDSLNEENANNAPFHYQALRRSFSGKALNLKQDVNEETKSNKNHEKSVADAEPPTPSGSPLSHYDFQRRMMLLKNKRVCYACSSASNPTCEHPDRSTTIKYCSPEQDACVVKSYTTHSKTKVIVRDCATSCKEDDPLHISPKYKKCTMCKEDLCNSAYLIDSKSTLFFGTICALIAVWKSV